MIRQSGLAFATLALIASGLTSPRAETVRARYAVSLVGLHIGEVAAVSSFDSSKYRIDFNARLTGVAAMVADVKMALSSTGSVQGGVISPATYVTTAANSRETRTVRMALSGGSVKSLNITPPWDDKEGRVPVTDANRRNVLDPTSAFIMSVPPGQPLVGPAACNRKIPVFDGYLRFDVTLFYVGSRNVDMAGYSGPVSVCAARYTPIAGHKRDSRSTRFMADNRQIEVWLAPIEHAHVVAPLRVALMTLAGNAVIEAVEFSVDASDVTATTH
ncbi:DUF3108 domain-containing protein [Methylocella silvestris]|uniref:DUF3108 domain-containing protein n=1 Tax=Methylocella silvestris TaxID=199596 RepID=A0A2J7TIV1_METSI|nr:DUF3108 domain-containing protein [Methylocella silvestris]PNG26703.1 hypothetical protein CR492_06835 [Methylocella silvestris]